MVPSGKVRKGSPSIMFADYIFSENREHVEDSLEWRVCALETIGSNTEYTDQV